MKVNVWQKQRNINDQLVAPVLSRDVCQCLALDPCKKSIKKRRTKPPKRILRAQTQCGGQPRQPRVTASQQEKKFSLPLPSGRGYFSACPFYIHFLRSFPLYPPHPHLHSHLLFTYKTCPRSQKKSRSQRQRPPRRSRSQRRVSPLPSACSSSAYPSIRAPALPSSFSIYPSLARPSFPLPIATSFPIIFIPVPVLFFPLFWS